MKSQRRKKEKAKHKRKGDTKEQSDVMCGKHTKRSAYPEKSFGSVNTAIAEAIR